jgi:hypothetical protein
MTLTVTCNCGWCTDIETTSETNPHHCPECYGVIMLGLTDEPLYISGELNPILFDGDVVR